MSTEEETQLVRVRVTEEVKAYCTVEIEVPADLEGKALKDFIASDDNQWVTDCFCQLERRDMIDFHEDVEERWFEFERVVEPGKKTPPEPPSKRDRILAALLINYIEEDVDAEATAETAGVTADDVRDLMRALNITSKELGV